MAKVLTERIPFLYEDAAVLMLKNKIHRIPIVNDSHQVVGKSLDLLLVSSSMD